MRPCPTPRCPALTQGGHCATHKRERRQVSDSHRGSARERGYTAAWDRYSKAFLRAHPLCVACENEGRLTPSAVTDHVIPHKGDAALFWDTANHQALCRQCHNRKTAAEDGGFGRPARSPRSEKSGDPASGPAGHPDFSVYEIGGRPR
jgi:5-methylcytosine-specific restriction enzyme A